MVNHYLKLTHFYVLCSQARTQIRRKTASISSAALSYLLYLHICSLSELVISVNSYPPFSSCCLVMCLEMVYTTDIYLNTSHEGSFVFLTHIPVCISVYFCCRNAPYLYLFINLQVLLKTIQTAILPPFTSSPSSPPGSRPIGG